MAKEKRSLFEWLTGSQSDDFTFDELEQGGASYAPKPVKTKNVPVSSSSAEPNEVVEEEESGELAVDVYQTPSHSVIKAMVAGVRPEDLDVSIPRDLVTMRGKRERASEGSNGD